MLLVIDNFYFLMEIVMLFDNRMEHECVYMLLYKLGAILIDKNPSSLYPQVGQVK